MEVVYKAEDSMLGRFVTLKFLPEAVSKDRHAPKRFQRETKLLRLSITPTSAPSTKSTNMKC